MKEGLRKGRVVSPGNQRDRQDTMSHPVRFALRPFSAVGIRTSAVEEGQLSKQAWRVDTRSVRLVAARTLQFPKLAAAWPTETSAQARPLP